jgi:serralysin
MQLFRSLSKNFALWFIVAAVTAPECWGAASGANDPAGDTFGSPNLVHDIALFDAQVSPGSVRFVFEFYGSIAPPSAFAPESVVGYIDIDVDQNPLTGSPSNTSRFIAGGDASLGIELYIDLFSERFHPGTVELIDPKTVQSIGMAGVTYSPLGFTVDLPLSFLAGESLINYGAIVGDFVDMSDAAEFVLVPEPATLASAMFAAAFTARMRRRRHH